MHHNSGQQEPMIGTWAYLLSKVNILIYKYNIEEQPIFFPLDSAFLFSHFSSLTQSPLCKSLNHDPFNLLKNNSGSTAGTWVPILLLLHSMACASAFRSHSLQFCEQTGAFLKSILLEDKELNASKTIYPASSNVLRSYII